MNLAAMAGMSSGKRKKTRRGGRGAKSSRPSTGASGAEGHHAKLNEAMAAGDHAQAKTHAFNLGKALHVMTQGTPGVSVQPSSVPDPIAAPDATDMEMNTGSQSPTLPPSGQSKSGPAALAMRARAAMALRSK